MKTVRRLEIGSNACDYQHGLSKEGLPRAGGCPPGILFLKGCHARSQHLSIRLSTLAYKKSEFQDEQAILSRMKRNIVNLMFEHLDYLQQFDKVKIYYNDGQSVVTSTLHDAAE